MKSSNGNIFRVTGHLCGEFTGPWWIPTQRPVTRNFDAFFDLRLNKRLSKQSWGWWFETLSRPLWHHRNDVGVTGSCPPRGRISTECRWIIQNANVLTKHLPGKQRTICLFHSSLQFLCWQRHPERNPLWPYMFPEIIAVVPWLLLFITTELRGVFTTMSVLLALAFNYSWQTRLNCFSLNFFLKRGGINKKFVFLLLYYRISFHFPVSFGEAHRWQVHRLWQWLGAARRKAVTCTYISQIKWR